MLIAFSHSDLQTFSHARTPYNRPIRDAAIKSSIRSFMNDPTVWDTIAIHVMDGGQRCVGHIMGAHTKHAGGCGRAIADYILKRGSAFLLLLGSGIKLRQKKVAKCLRQNVCL